MNATNKRGLDAWFEQTLPTSVDLSALLPTASNTPCAFGSSQPAFMVAAPYEGGNDDDWDDDEEDWEDEDRDDDEDDWDEDENEDDWDEDEDEDDEYEAFYKQDEPGRIQPFRANRRFRDEDQGPRPHPKRKHHRPPRIKGAYDEDAPDEEDEPWDR